MRPINFEETESTSGSGGVADTVAVVITIADAVYDFGKGFVQGLEEGWSAAQSSGTGGSGSNSTKGG